MKIALYQMHIVWEDKAANFAKLEARLKEAVAAGVDFFLLPEMSFTGFSMHTEMTAEKTDLSSERTEETVTKVKLLAERYHIAIGFGWVKDCGAKAENHYTVVNKAGEVISDYAKIHPFSYSGEDVKFQGGNALTAFDMEGIPFSGFICYDLRFPEIFQAVSDTAHVILLPADWPARRSHHWKTLLQARAIENQVYILAVNCVGQIDDLYYSGDSCVINPNGEVLQMLSDEEGLVIFELTDDVEEYRKAFPVKQDRRQKLYAGW